MNMFVCKHKGPLIVRNDKILYVDVDDTLIVWAPDLATYTPHKKHINLVKRFFERGQPVIIWSAGGYAWAERIAKEVGLFNHATAIMSKPVWWMDDLTATEVLLESGRIYFKDED